MRPNAAVLSVRDTVEAGPMDNILSFPGLRVRARSEPNPAKEMLLKVVLAETRRNESWETLAYLIIASAAVGAITVSVVGAW